MLKSLKLTNFRQHRNLEVNFGGDLNVIRAQNEGGKTTLIEALAYLLGGVKACREPLAKLIPWESGLAEKDVKVEGVLTFEGTAYSGKRSKGGAEIVYTLNAVEQRVVGQTECTAFWERLIGVDMVTMTRLMLAEQGTIRGALAEGGKTTMQLIETMANFDQIDALIDLVQAKLLTGPPAMAQDRLKRAQEAACATRAAVVLPDTDTLVRAAKDAQAALKSAQAGKAEWQPKLDIAQQAVSLAASAAASVQVLTRQRDVAQNGLAQLHVQFDEAQAAKKGAPGEVDVMAAQTELRKAEESFANFAARHRAWNEVQALIRAYPKVNWDEPRATIDEAIRVARATVQTLAVELQTARNEENRLTSSRQSGEGKCKSCGQALPNADAIAAHNAEIDQLISAIRASVKAANNARSEAEAELNDLLAVMKSAEPYEALAVKYPDLVRREDTAVPPVLVWTAEVPTDEGKGKEVERLRAQLAKLQAAHKVAVEAGARAAVYEASIKTSEATIERLTKELAEFEGPAADLEQRKAVLENVEGQYNAHANAVVENEFEYARIAAEIDRLQERYETAMSEVAKLDAAAEAAQVELLALEFNNALVKRIKAIRPMVSDKLWGIVLATVSGYFSQMRGKKSVITREGSEFLCDGKSVPGLSGSTLDILGLSIRLALTRTFLPNAPFLILDEPCAAMDETRAGETLGFLATTGFPQTLLITHEEMSEAMAQHLITL